MRKETNILILPVGKGEKFRFAEKWRTKCLSPSWIGCCLKKGYAVKYQDYIVKSAEKKCSTPKNTFNSEFFQAIPSHVKFITFMFIIITIISQTWSP